MQKRAFAWTENMYKKMRDGTTYSPFRLAMSDNVDPGQALWGDHAARSASEPVRPRQPLEASKAGLGLTFGSQ